MPDFSGKRSSFTCFWLGEAASVLGYQMLVVAVAWQTYELTDSALSLGLIQLETPDETRGRVSAVNSLFTSTSNQLGQFESGVAAALFGTVPAVVIGGLGTIFVAALWIRLFPELYQRDVLTVRAS